MDARPVVQKAQPWKKSWPPAGGKSCPGIEYGIEKGEVVVVDGTSANVKPKKAAGNIHAKPVA